MWRGGCRSEFVSLSKKIVPSLNHRRLHQEFSPRWKRKVRRCTQKVFGASHGLRGARSFPARMSQEYKVKLEVFEGPLDLLLYLIKQDEVDI